MNVAKYTFQSPYPSPVQVGRLDPNSTKERGTESSDSNFLAKTNQTLSDAQNFQASQKKEVTPSMDESRLLDTYA